MKKLINILFLIFLCPIVFGAVNALPNTPQTDTQNSGFDKSLNINSTDLGYNGPVSFGILYSDNFGAMLQAKLLQGLNKNNAIGLEVEGGQGQRRINATWGFGFTPNQRIKLTAENLAQKMEFDFDSGKTKRWVDQNAYGVGYQYLIPNSFINDINVDAFYSRAISQSLSSRNYTSGGLNYINYRHIAGGTDKSGSIGIDLLPSHATLIGLQANYDHVDYNMRYEKNQNDSGLGATITLDQLISNHVKFNLLASNRKPYDDYQAGINWLLNSAPGSQLELGVNGEYLQGSHGIDNDTKGGITLAYSWGGNSIGHLASYSDFGSANSNSITAFTNIPAVHMQQVLAVRDQKSVTIVTSSSNISETHHTPYLNPNYHPQNITIIVGKKFVKTFFALDLFNDDQSIFDSLRLLLTGLDSSGLKSDFAPDPDRLDNGVLTILGTASTTPAVYHVQIHAHNLYGDATETQNFTITIKKQPEPVITIPQQNFQFLQQVNEDITQYIDSGEGKIKSIDCYDLDFYGLHINVDSDTQKVTLSGTVRLPTDEIITVPIAVTNTSDIKTNSSFKMAISGPPIKQSNIFPHTATEGETISSIPVGSHFHIPANSGQISDWVIEVQDKDGHVIASSIDEMESRLGLTMKNNEVVGTLKQVSSGSPYMFYFTARNAQGSSIDVNGRPVAVKMRLYVNPV